MHESNIPTALEKAKAYLLEDPEVERGGLITNDGKFIPFDNQSVTPQGTIQIGPDDLRIMTRLLRKDNLYGWIHSHPHCAAYPSIIDITMHDVPINMIIYSVSEDMMTTYSNETVNALKSGLSDGSWWVEKAQR